MLRRRNPDVAAKPRGVCEGNGTNKVIKSINLKSFESIKF